MAPSCMASLLNKHYSTTQVKQHQQQQPVSSIFCWNMHQLRPEWCHKNSHVQVTSSLKHTTSKKGLLAYTRDTAIHRLQLVDVMHCALTAWHLHRVPCRDVIIHDVTELSVSSN